MDGVRALVPVVGVEDAVDDELADVLGEHGCKASAYRCIRIEERRASGEELTWHLKPTHTYTQKLVCHPHKSHKTHETPQ